jgi:hypothetical protein
MAPKHSLIMLIGFNFITKLITKMSISVEEVFLILNCAVISIGCIACLILVYIIVQKNVWNDFNRLIFIIMLFEFVFFLFHIDNVLILAHTADTNGRSVSMRSINLVGEVASVS